MCEFEGSSVPPPSLNNDQKPVPAKASGRAPCPTGTAGETINRTNQVARLRTTAATSRNDKRPRQRLEADRPVRDRARRPARPRMERKAGQARTPPDSPAMTDRSVRAPTMQTRSSSHTSDRACPSSSKTSKAAFRAACACRSRAGPAPASSPGPIAPGFRPPQPRASTGPANPTDEPHEVAAPRLAPRSTRHARAERA